MRPGSVSATKAAIADSTTRPRTARGCPRATGHHEEETDGIGRDFMEQAPQGPVDHIGIGVAGEGARHTVFDRHQRQRAQEPRCGLRWIPPWRRSHKPATASPAAQRRGRARSGGRARTRKLPRFAAPRWLSRKGPRGRRTAPRPSRPAHGRSALRAARACRALAPAAKRG